MRVCARCHCHQADQLSQALQDWYGIVVSLAQLLDSEQFVGVSSRLLIAVDEDAEAIMKAGNMLLVINYQVPMDVESYMGRLRCSRGASSVAINLVSSRWAFVCPPPPPPPRLAYPLRQTS